MVPPPVGVCNQITLLIPYNISSRLVTYLTITDAPTQVSNIFYLTETSTLINRSSQEFLNFFLKCLLPSRLTLFVLSKLLWFGSHDHCILACFLFSINLVHFTSSRGLCCLHSYRPRLFLAEVLIFSVMFYQALFISSLSFNFSKATDFFEILI